MLLCWFDTHVTPAGDALHLAHQRHARVPILAVLIIVFAKLAVSRAVRLHHFIIFQEGRVLRGTLLTAVRRVASDWPAAGEDGTGHLLAVDFTRGALGRTQMRDVS